MPHATTDLEELWRRVAFPILINNGDDHLHNRGFLHVEGVLWRLAPAFDIDRVPRRANSTPESARTWALRAEAQRHMIA